MADGNLEYIQDTQTLIGSRKRELIDVQTGEQIFVDQITKRVYGSKNFWKCYLMDFLTVLGIIDIDILPRLKPWDSLDSCSVIQPYRLKYSHSVQDLC